MRNAARSGSSIQICCEHDYENFSKSNNRGSPLEYNVLPWITTGDLEAISPALRYFYTPRNIQLSAFALEFFVGFHCSQNKSQESSRIMWRNLFWNVPCWLRLSCQLAPYFSGSVTGVSRRNWITLWSRGSLLILGVASVLVVSLYCFVLKAPLFITETFSFWTGLKQFVRVLTSCVRPLYTVREKYLWHVFL